MTEKNKGCVSMRENHDAENYRCIASLSESGEDLEGILNGTDFNSGKIMEGSTHK